MFQGRGAATKIAWPFDPNDPCKESNRMNNGKRPGRPASIRTRNFRRYLTDTEAAILAHAGSGDMSAGFRNVIDLYWQNVNAVNSDNTLKPQEND
jgi:hypothetical protein